MPADLAQFLRQEMTRRGWTQATLAERAGITGATLTNILNNPDKVVPRLETLAALAKVLEVSLARLIGLCGFPIEARSTENEQLIDRMNDDCLLRATIEILAALPELYQRLMHHQAVYLWRLANQDADTVREKP